MGKCGKCGKWNFLLSNGICSKCKNMFEQERQSAISTESYFKIDKMKYLQGPGMRYYFLGKDDIFHATSDIMYMNTFIKEAREILPKLPNFHIFRERLNFKQPKKLGEGPPFTFVEFAQLTSTGKKSKYPIILYFQSICEGGHLAEFKDSVRGHIKYLQNSAIGKAELICWRLNKCFIIHIDIEKKSNKLSVSKVETTKEDGKRNILYKRDN